MIRYRNGGSGDELSTCPSYQSNYLYHNNQIQTVQWKDLLVCLSSDYLDGLVQALIVLLVLLGQIYVLLLILIVKIFPLLF